MMFRNFSISFPLNTTQEQHFRTQEQPQAYSTLLKPLSAQPERQTKFQSLGWEVRELSFHYKQWHLFFCSLQKYISLGNVGWSTQCHSFSRSVTNSAYFSVNAHEELDRFPLILGFLPFSKSARRTKQPTFKQSLLLSTGCAVHVFPCIQQRLLNGWHCARCFGKIQRQTMHSRSQHRGRDRVNSASWFLGTDFPLSKYVLYMLHGLCPLWV